MCVNSLIMFISVKKETKINKGKVMADIKKLLGAKISQLRKEKNITQMAFAEQIGISTNALGIIETGNGFLTAETLEKILKTLNLEPDELFSFGGLKSNEEIHKDIIRKIDILKNNRAKLITLDNIIKNLI